MNRKLPPVIALCGYAGAGKSTAAQILESDFGYSVTHFATPIKAAVRAMFPKLPESYITGDHKESPISGYYPLDVTSRHIQQTLGTEWGREFIHDNLWARIWFQTAWDLRNVGQRVIVDDLRFPNEWSAVGALDGIIWRIYDPNADAPTHTHESEAYVKDLPAVAEIANERRSMHALTQSIDDELHIWEANQS